MWMVVVAEVESLGPKKPISKSSRQGKGHLAKAQIASPSANFLSPPRHPDERSRKYYHQYAQFDLADVPPTV